MNPILCRFRCHPRLPDYLAEAARPEQHSLDFPSEPLGGSSPAMRRGLFARRHTRHACPHTAHPGLVHAAIRDLVCPLKLFDPLARLPKHVMARSTRTIALSVALSPMARFQVGP